MAISKYKGNAKNHRLHAIMKLYSKMFHQHRTEVSGVKKIHDKNHTYQYIWSEYTDMNSHVQLIMIIKELLRY